MLMQVSPVPNALISSVVSDSNSFWFQSYGATKFLDKQLSEGAGLFTAPTDLSDIASRTVLRERLQSGVNFRIELGAETVTFHLIALRAASNGEDTAEGIQSPQHLRYSVSVSIAEFEQAVGAANFHELRKLLYPSSSSPSVSISPALVDECFIGAGATSRPLGTDRVDLGADLDIPRKF